MPEVRRTGDAHHHRRRGTDFQRRGFLYHRQSFFGLQEGGKLGQLPIERAVDLADTLNFDAINGIIVSIKR